MSDEQVEKIMVVAQPARGRNPYDNQVVLYDLENEVMIARTPGVHEVANTEQVQFLIMRGVLRKATSAEAGAVRGLRKATSNDASDLDAALARIRELEADVAAKAEAQVNPDVTPEIAAQFDPGTGSVRTQTDVAVQQTRQDITAETDEKARKQAEKDAAKAAKQAANS